MEYSRYLFHPYQDQTMFNDFHMFFYNGSVSVIFVYVCVCVGCPVFSAAFILSTQPCFLFTSAT